MEKYKKKLAVGILLILAAVFLAANMLWREEKETLNYTGEGTKALIAVDAGHGGFDPGKVGTAGTLEKDINLSVAKKVEKILTDSGYRVVMTRTEDVALCGDGDTKKKMADLRNRVARIEEEKPALAVSIHQNSFSAGTKGAQVFYFTSSEPGKKLAGQIQSAIKDTVGDDNQRVEKGNSEYYMLKNVTVPFVIVECGFLSNPEEEGLLRDEAYQEKMARGICEGIENFLYK